MQASEELLVAHTIRHQLDGPSTFSVTNKHAHHLQILLRCHAMNACAEIKGDHRRSKHTIS